MRYCASQKIRRGADAVDEHCALIYRIATPATRPSLRRSDLDYAAKSTSFT
jgi:hypothetical protein